MTIQISELLEICSYSIGEKMAKELARHFEKYQDYGRVKALIVQQMVQNTEKVFRQEKMIKALAKKNDELEQLTIKES